MKIWGLFFFATCFFLLQNKSAIIARNVTKVKTIIDGFYQTMTPDLTNHSTIATNIVAPEVLLSGYAQGIFPMSPRKSSKKIAELEWFLPHFRGIIPLDQFKITKNTARNLRKTPHTVHFNRDFRGTMLACASRRETWISPVITASYENLHRLGFAHSVEVYDESDILVGGLYGVTLGTAFFGESMFHFRPDADKFALYYCHQRLLERGFTLWDTQFYTDHLGTFGAIEIPNEDYQHLLQQALVSQVVFFP